MEVLLTLSHLNLLLLDHLNLLGALLSKLLRSLLRSFGLLRSLLRSPSFLRSLSQSLIRGLLASSSLLSSSSLERSLSDSLFNDSSLSFLSFQICLDKKGRGPAIDGPAFGGALGGEVNSLTIGGNTKIAEVAELEFALSRRTVGAIGGV